MMRKLIDNTSGHSLKEKRVIHKHLMCTACSQGKLIVKPSPIKVTKETINFLERIQGDICGPIHPHCGTFRCFMVLIDASTRMVACLSPIDPQLGIPKIASSDNKITSSLSRFSFEDYTS